VVRRWGRQRLFRPICSPDSSADNYVPSTFRSCLLVAIVPFCLYSASMRTYGLESHPITVFMNCLTAILASFLFMTFRLIARVPYITPQLLTSPGRGISLILSVGKMVVGSPSCSIIFPSSSFPPVTTFLACTLCGKAYPLLLRTLE